MALTPHASRVSTMSSAPAHVSAAAHDAAASMVLTHIDDRVPRALTIIETKVPQKLSPIEQRVLQRLRTETQRSCTVVSTVSTASHMISKSARGQKLAHQLQHENNADLSVLKKLTTRDSTMPKHDARKPPRAPHSPPVRRPPGIDERKVVHQLTGVSIRKLHSPPHTAEHDDRTRLRHPASHRMPPTMIPRPAGCMVDWERGALMEPEASAAAEELAEASCIELDKGTSRNTIPKMIASRNLAFMSLITTILCVFSI